MWHILCTVDFRKDWFGSARSKQWKWGINWLIAPQYDGFLSVFHTAKNTSTTDTIVSYFNAICVITTFLRLTEACLSNIYSLFSSDFGLHQLLREISAQSLTWFVQCLVIGGSHTSLFGWTQLSAASGNKADYCGWIGKKTKFVVCCVWVKPSSHCACLENKEPCWFVWGHWINEETSCLLSPCV